MVADCSIKYSFNEFEVMFVKSVPLNLQVDKKTAAECPKLQYIYKRKL